jgi:hypothetical protein
MSRQLIILKILYNKINKLIKDDLYNTDQHQFNITPTKEKNVDFEK